MPKDRHHKRKLNVRLSPRAFETLQKFSETFSFGTLTDALEYILIEYASPIFTNPDEEKSYIEALRKFQNQNKIKDIAEASEAFYKAGQPGYS